MIVRLKLTVVYICRIAAITESGLIQRWMKKYWPEENKCDKSLSSVGHRKTKISTTGACIALVLGVTVAFLVFLLELISKIIRAV